VCFWPQKLTTFAPLFKGASLVKGFLCKEWFWR